jgi:hypothetical protein
MNAELDSLQKTSLSYLITGMSTQWKLPEIGNQNIYGRLSHRNRGEIK